MRTPSHLRAIVAAALAARLLAILVGNSTAAETERKQVGREYHVSVRGANDGDGSANRPFSTISAAARLAKPGDTITVHAGVYRERVAPPLGGTSDERRIVYQAAKGEKVVLKGSEVVKGWKKIGHDTWTVTLPGEFFGDYNPFDDLIRGDWFNGKGRPHHTGAVYLNDHWLTEAAKKDAVLAPATRTPLWFAEVNQKRTTIWAQFKRVDPNADRVEVNVRPTVFYPEKPFVNYITVRGFTLMHAATQWAPPTAEQIGLIGTHWSKGWIIENNDIRYSTCVGVTLGKYGDRWDNTSANTAEGYVKTIERALENGWNKETIGGHVVRENHISHCEQAGLVGSMGAVFSTITDNTIHDIHVRRLFTGAEMAGIKIHAAIDTEIARNHIFRTCRGIWLDWMAQGTRVTANLLHDNGPSEDLFVEVNHGPFLIDNNLFLSKCSLMDWSQGGAYVHNLFAGRVVHRPEVNRETPFHPAHATQMAGLSNIPGGDDRFYNNLFLGPADLTTYDNAAHQVWMSGNVFVKGAIPSKWETAPTIKTGFDPNLLLSENPGGTELEITLDKSWAKMPRSLVTTELLGKAKIPGLSWVGSDGKPYRIDTDYFGKTRDVKSPFPGPFELPAGGRVELEVGRNR